MCNASLSQSYVLSLITSIVINLEKHCHVKIGKIRKTVNIKLEILDNRLSSQSVRPAGPAVIRRSGLIRMIIPVIVDMAGKYLLERNAARY